MNALTGSQILLDEIARHTLEDRISDARRRSRARSARAARREARREARRTRPTATAPVLPTAALRFLHAAH
jgi:hypothetical protein